ncbi:MAG: restriction endonuclease subunit S [Oscillospiraceae bacterium]
MSREMKDSGIEWIGSLPSTWKICKVKNCFVRKNDKAMQEDPVILSLARSGVKIRDISKNEGQIAESYYNYNPVEPGDLLLNPMDLYSGANCSISEVTGVISPAYINLKAKTGVNPRYFDYYFKTQYWAMAFFAHGKGVSFDNRWTMSADSLLNYYIPLPPVAEQNQIAVFLDKKCFGIDSTMERTRASIEEYKKLKQAVITQAVTKGIHKGVEMASSKREWIRTYPKHWKEIRIKWLLDERKEHSAEGREEPLSMSQKYGLIPTKEMDMVPNMATSFVGAKLAYKGDLVFNKLKAHLGVFAVSAYDGLVSPDYAVYYATGLANMKYLEYLFKTPQYIAEFKKKSTGVGAGLTRLYTAGLYSIYCALPPLDEQKEIADYLDRTCSEIDTLIAKKEQYLVELENYKKALIYEYVTGKKEVPEN